MLHELLHQLGLPHLSAPGANLAYADDVGNDKWNALNSSADKDQNTIGGRQADTLRGCLLAK